MFFNCCSAKKTNENIELENRLEEIHSATDEEINKLGRLVHKDGKINVVFLPTWYCWFNPFGKDGNTTHVDLL